MTKSSRGGSRKCPRDVVVESSLSINVNKGTVPSVSLKNFGLSLVKWGGVVEF